MAKYYVYELVLLPDQRVIYVGKGSGKRGWYHRHVLSHPENKQNLRPVYTAFRELLVSGKEFIERIVFESETELDCLKEEQRRIETYGFDNLLNVQSHAFTGRKLKPIVGRLISQKLKAYVQRCREKYGTGHPPEVAAKISRSNTGKRMSEKFKQKMRDLHASGAMEHVHKIFTEAGRKSQLEHGFTNEHRKRLGNARRGRVFQYRPRANPLQRKTLTSNRFKGVSILGGKWIARITVSGKVKYVGSSSNESEAARLYDNRAEELYGQRPNETARL